ITSHTNVLCSGGSTGSATVTASGGTAPYTYSWNSVPAQTTAAAINLIAGAYTVTVKDASGCEATASITLSEPTPIVVTTTNTNVDCFGDLTGTATATASGGLQPYTYAWTTIPVQTTAVATNLPAGTYTITVTDFLGCNKSASVTITQPANKLIASITDQVNVACFGDTTGLITVTGSGGIAPLQYNINGGAFQASGTFNNLAGGAYTIIARDANNCKVTILATITSPADDLTVTISSQTNIFCSGGSTGSATVIASGGTAPYTYLWNTVPVITSPTVNNLTAGVYIVTINDAAGCKKTLSVTITEPAPMILTSTKTDVACFGESTGTATAQISGGIPPYTYIWLTTPIRVTASVSNLPIGTYNVTVFDSSGCFKSTSVTITQPASALTATITDQLDVACAGNTGSLTASASGGVLPYAYSINGGSYQSSDIFNGLSAGVYTIIARDANNCIFSIPPATITEPANALHASITSQTNLLCVGDANGSATVTATNGTSPYTYSWNTIPVQTSATASNLAAGNYIVTTSDNLGCFVQDTAFITEPALALSVSITDQVNFDCATGTNGSVTVAGAGGTPNYQYSLDGGAYQVSGIFTNLPIADYIVTVRDTNNCTAQVPVKIILSGLILAVNDTFITSEDTQLNENVMTNDQVLCNLPINVTSNTPPQHGTVTVNADGTFTYMPEPDYNGSDSFNYTITDFVGATSTATVTVTIDPVNDHPVTLNDSITVKYNTATSENVLSNGHFDPDGTTLTVNTTPLADPVNGTFVIAADGTFTYTPNLNYIGDDMVILSLCDTGIPLPSACTNDTLFIVVLPPNQPPVSVPENIGLCMDGSFIGTLTNGGTVFNGDTDPENNLPLTLNSLPVQDAAHGTFTITDVIAGTFNYTPNTGYSGTDIVIVSICDSGLPVECSNDTIYIEVLLQIVADAGLSQKLCNADIATLVGNSPGTATGNWHFVSGPNTPTVTPSTGNVAIASGLIASLTPYVFGYSIDNGGCVSTDTMSIVNFIPATPAYAGMDQEFCNATGNFTVTLEGNIPMNGTGSWSQLAGPTATTILDPTNPNSNVSDLSFGIYTFQWLITNGLCQDNADAVNISVSQSVIANAGIDLSTCESAAVTVLGSNVLNSTSILWTTTGNGTFDDPTALTPAYTPGSLDLTMGTVKLVLTASANSPCTDASDFALLTINKTPFVNAGPDEGSICVGNSKTISQAIASDYSTLQWSVSPSSAGTLLNPETLNPIFTPAAGFSGTVTLTIQVQGLGTCIDLVRTDDMTFDVSSSLVADAGADQIIQPGTAANLSGLVSGGTGFYSWSWQPTSLLINGLIENPVTLALNADTTFILTVLDITTGCTDEDSVKVFMNKEPIPIVAVGDHDSTLVNSSVTIDVLSNDKNPDGDPLILSLCGNPSHGIVILNSDNTITYTPFSDYEGMDEFCYQICSTITPMYCADTVVKIQVKPPSLDDLHPYTGISPNQDGVNDVWKIRGIEKYPDNTVIIFNRWGDKLREFVNYNNTTHSWNGKNEQNNALPDGTYFYILDVKEVGVLKGWIYIRGK
ncbi:MAG: Ig-like domain-containing protein, partial [Bacteroidales bacterium]|nr:Ig-like domain-containing protein [Bacteroidales bacterium]